MSGLRRRGYVKGSQTPPSMPGLSTRSVGASGVIASSVTLITSLVQKKKKGKAAAKSDETKRKTNRGREEGPAETFSRMETEEGRVPPSTLIPLELNRGSENNPLPPLRPPRPPSAKRRRYSTGDHLTSQGAYDMCNACMIRVVVCIFSLCVLITTALE